MEMKARADRWQLVGLAAMGHDGVQTHSEGISVEFYKRESWRHGGRGSAGWCDAVVVVVVFSRFVAPAVFQQPTM